MPYPNLLIIGHYTVYSNQTRQKSPDLQIIIIIVKKAFPYLIIELVCSIQRYVNYSLQRCETRAYKRSV